MSLFITEAIAATATTTTAAPAQQGGMGSMLFLVGIFVAMYFLLIRPQSKRAKEHQRLVSTLNKGDEIITTGGIVGKVVNLTDEFISLAITDDITIALQRQAVAKTLPKGTMKSIA